MSSSFCFNLSTRLKNIITIIDNASFYISQWVNETWITNDCLNNNLHSFMFTIPANDNIIICNSTHRWFLKAKFSPKTFSHGKFNVFFSPFQKSDEWIFETFMTEETLTNIVNRVGKDFKEIETLFENVTAVFKAAYMQRVSWLKI